MLSSRAFAAPTLAQNVWAAYEANCCLEAAAAAAATALSPSSSSSLSSPRARPAVSVRDVLSDNLEKNEKKVQLHLLREGPQEQQFAVASDPTSNLDYCHPHAPRDLLGVRRNRPDAGVDHDSIDAAFIMKGKVLPVPTGLPRSRSSGDFSMITGASSQTRPEPAEGASEDNSSRITCLMSSRHSSHQQQQAPSPLAPAGSRNQTPVVEAVGDGEPAAFWRQGKEAPRRHLQFVSETLNVVGSTTVQPGDVVTGDTLLRVLMDDEPRQNTTQCEPYTSSSSVVGNAGRLTPPIRLMDVGRRRNQERPSTAGRGFSKAGLLSPSAAADLKAGGRSQLFGPMSPSAGSDSSSGPGSPKSFEEDIDDVGNEEGSALRPPPVARQVNSTMGSGVGGGSETISKTKGCGVRTEARGRSGFVMPGSRPAHNNGSNSRPGFWRSPTSAPSRSGEATGTASRDELLRKMVETVVKRIATTASFSERGETASDDDETFEAPSTHWRFLSSKKLRLPAKSRSSPSVVLPSSPLVTDGNKASSSPSESPRAVHFGCTPGYEEEDDDNADHNINLVSAEEPLGYSTLWQRTARRVRSTVRRNPKRVDSQVDPDVNEEPFSGDLVARGALLPRLSTTAETGKQAARRPGAVRQSLDETVLDTSRVGSYADGLQNSAIFLTTCDDVDDNEAGTVGARRSFRRFDDECSDGRRGSRARRLEIPDLAGGSLLANGTDKQLQQQHDTSSARRHRTKSLAGIAKSVLHFLQDRNDSFRRKVDRHHACNQELLEQALESEQVRHRIAAQYGACWSLLDNSSVTGEELTRVPKSQLLHQESLEGIASNVRLLFPELLVGGEQSAANTLELRAGDNGTRTNSAGGAVAVSSNARQSKSSRRTAQALQANNNCVSGSNGARVSSSHLPSPDSPVERNLTTSESLGSSESLSCFFFPSASSSGHRLMASNTNNNSGSGVMPNFDACLDAKLLRAKLRNPSTACSLRTYIDILQAVPIRCFQGELELGAADVLPHLKQDSKDISRDTLEVNGRPMGGSLGYTAILQELSSRLSSHESAAAVDASTEARGGDEAGESNSESLVGELRAIVLLHLIGRTLSGGLCLEKVLDVYENVGLEVLIVPDSRGAAPLKLAIAPCDNGLTVAAMQSHTRFNVIASTFPTGSGRSTAGTRHGAPLDSDPPLLRVVSPPQQQQSCDVATASDDYFARPLACVDAYFICNMIVEQSLDSATLRSIAEHIAQDECWNDREFVATLPPGLRNQLAPGFETLQTSLLQPHAHNSQKRLIPYKIYFKCQLPHAPPVSNATASS